MRWIDFIFIHCSAGHANIKAVQAFWHRPKSQGGAGWKIGGYHAWVDYDGTITWLYPISQIVNGVLGFNTKGIHIGYRGGVRKDNFKIAEDTRTEEQKAGILDAIFQIYEELKLHQPVDHIKILGHRDASPDKNLNGIIEPWERIKECPSFDAIPEYAWIQGSVANQRKGIL
ncbi:N-acetylmuramoyl-L-alanine amidase [Belliella sp. DSM 107340]|uniref:N-acetylmuramoyl-L-alanine amidase n=1 Tax=Belliella calami TaxID=2923436 RepID=A0ABS9UU16_9BACT|nr:N-acetylmuramoyl-L-alanine amidase [Belliella calami]MCH7400122.1 N-acetylmuramoyl-L-alanine amidase [Belliella calami]